MQVSVRAMITKQLTIFSLGGIIILIIPFIGFAYMALRKAFSKSYFGSAEHERVSFNVYALSTIASMIYFFTVSYSTLSDWKWGERRFYTWMFQDIFDKTMSEWEVDRFLRTLIWGEDTEPFTWFERGTGSMSKLYMDNVITVTSNHVQYLLDIGGWVNIPFGLDGLSLSLILLTAAIFPLTFIYCWRNVANREAMCFYLLILEILLVVAFWTRDLVLFFVLFEVILWPMYRLIVVWGSHAQKRKAAMSFVLYTIFGSLILLVVIITLLTAFGTTAIDAMNVNFSSDVWWITLLWIPAFVSFGVKVPTFPFHHWPTHAHVEAPTVGSVILAALLLKLGSYGFLRYMLPIFSDPVNFEQFMPVACTLCLLSVIFAALMAISQSDLKRIVAYSPISHMNFSLLGLLSMTDRAIVGGTILFIAHGFISAAMFFSVGMLYDRYHQRDIGYYRGLSSIAPVFSTLFFLTNLANLGVPLSFNFLGEFVIYTELINIYHFAVPLLIIALIIQVGYTMKLISILFGEIIQFANVPSLAWTDLTLYEIVILLMLVIPAYYFGVYSDVFIDLMTVIDPLLTHHSGLDIIITEPLVRGALVT